MRDDRGLLVAMPGDGQVDEAAYRGVAAVGGEQDRAAHAAAVAELDDDLAFVSRHRLDLRTELELRLRRGRERFAERRPQQRVLDDRA